MDATPAHGLQGAQQPHELCSPSFDWNLAGQASPKFQGCLESSSCSELTRLSGWRSQGRAWPHSPPPALGSVPQQAGESILTSSQHPTTIPPGRELRIAMLGSQGPSLCLTQRGAFWLRVRATWVQVLVLPLLAR